MEADARRLSRSVWELLMMLPTSPTHLEGFTQQVTPLALRPHLLLL